MGREHREEVSPANPPHYRMDEVLTMQYTVPFVFHGKENAVTVDYGPIPNVRTPGFHVLNLPFDPGACIGYPMLHARFERLNLTGYERYCGWIQFIRREEYSDVDAPSPAHILYELDVPEDLLALGLPYFAFGYPAELFDAPCRNLRQSQKLVWTACTYLVDIPSRINSYQLSFLAGFSWGYTENIRGEVSLQDFRLLTQEDWLRDKAHLPSA